MKPDAWATFTADNRTMDDLEYHFEHLNLEEDTHREPLFSESSIEDFIDNIWQSCLKDKVENSDQAFGMKVLARELKKELEQGGEEVEES